MSENHDSQGPLRQGSDGERAAARALIDQAARRLATQAPDAPPSFTADLFGKAAPEDVLAVPAAELARIAGEAWLFISMRNAGEPKVRVVTPPVQPEQRATAFSVIEILNDDMRFLVDSAMAELTRQAIGVRLVAHPIFSIVRGAGGRITAYHGLAPREGVKRESFIHIHTALIDSDKKREQLAASLKNVFAEVRVAVSDWQAMKARVGEMIASLKVKPPPLPPAELSESVEFLEWLAADNFTFLGVREYTLAGETLEPDYDTSLGLLRSRDMHVLKKGTETLEVTPQVLAFLKEPRLLVVTKANVRSRVHRHAYLDYVGVKRFDASGKLIGEFRIIGLFTSSAYTKPVRSIPYLRRKIAAVEARAGLDPDTHTAKALANVLETYPRDELFQIEDDTLLEFATSILHLEERPRVRVLVRPDRFGRYMSVLVYVPRDRYDSRVRRLIGDYLAKAFNGHVSAYNPLFLEGPLTRVHFIIGRPAGQQQHVDRAVLETAVSEIVRSWADSLSDAVAAAYVPDKSQALLARYRDAFSVAFRDNYPAAQALSGIRMVESLTAEGPLGVDFYERAGEEEKGGVGLKVWSLGRPRPLSARVPVLEHMGFRVIEERTYRVGPEGGTPAWLHDMLLRRSDGGPVDLEETKPRLEAAFLMAMRGVTESDGYNALVLTGGLAWRDVALIRAISRFLRQVRVPYSQDYMWATLCKHAGIASEIVRLFHVRFDPRPEASQDRESQEEIIAASIQDALDKVDSLDEDRILRRFLNAVSGAVRTNFFQLDKEGGPKPLISIKFESRKLDDMPLPRPLFEIFVYSPRVEGVHLRFGKVARGGIRWSDRPQDFRTEVLGLVKAQQVKNAVIVPVGAKGGFVPKYLPDIAKRGGKREEIQAEGVAAYTQFIQALLDITDNIDAANAIVHPDNVVRHDSDDPYLVVAADKGTATFSDTANGISTAHVFWLDDAFASGGSVGYDHKAMGITARGAWESVKRHFREMDVNIGVTPFTAVGVGDMSGDVFGNGLLREKTTKLVAAFDHRDIFIDPSPDPEKSFAERARLFALPRSSWQDYDKALISKGGGIYPRSLKAIDLSPEAQAVLGFAREKATPAEVMNAILKAPADLLFFGGIGTYVRSSLEGDDAAGDRANDAIRVTGAQLRCKVVGEGANLGMTQRGRIEAAAAGVRINTDAIDNSAGVNTSDVEVNIKIALSQPVREKALTYEARNKLLAEMTDEVAQLVLRNNYLQTLALSLAQRRGLEDVGFMQRLMQALEARGELDRAVEYLPDDIVVAERFKRGQGFTRPELAVLLAYAKLTLFSDLLDSDLPDEPYLKQELVRYFPQQMPQRFPAALEKHRLRREIIATQVTNAMINSGGPALAVRLSDQTGAAAAGIAASFIAVRDSYGMPALNAEIDELDNKVSGEAQLALYSAVGALLLDRMVWFLRNAAMGGGLDAVVAHYREGIAAVAAALDGALAKDALAARDARQATLAEAGVPAPAARRFADLPLLKSAPDIVLVAAREKKPVAQVAATYFATQAFFGVDNIAAAAQGVAVEDYFDRLALDRALDQIGEAGRRLTSSMLGNGHAGASAVDAWVSENAQEVERTRAAIEQIAAGGLTLSKVTVAASLLNDLAKH